MQDEKSMQPKAVNDEEWAARKERARAFLREGIKKGRAWTSKAYAYTTPVVAARAGTNKS